MSTLGYITLHKCLFCIDVSQTRIHWKVERFVAHAFSTVKHSTPRTTLFCKSQLANAPALLPIACSRRDTLCWLHVFGACLIGRMILARPFVYCLGSRDSTETSMRCTKHLRIYAALMLPASSLSAKWVWKRRL